MIHANVRFRQRKLVPAAFGYFYDGRQYHGTEREVGEGSGQRGF